MTKVKIVKKYTDLPEVHHS